MGSSGLELLDVGVRAELEACIGGMGGNGSVHIWRGLVIGTGGSTVPADGPEHDGVRPSVDIVLLVQPWYWLSGLKADMLGEVGTGGRWGIIVPADVLAPDRARPSAGTVQPCCWLSGLKAGEIGPAGIGGDPKLKGQRLPLLWLRWPSLVWLRWRPLLWLRWPPLVGLRWPPLVWLR